MCKVQTFIQILLLYVEGSHRCMILYFIIFKLRCNDWQTILNASDYDAPSKHLSTSIVNTQEFTQRERSIAFLVT